MGDSRVSVGRRLMVGAGDMTVVCTTMVVSGGESLVKTLEEAGEGCLECQTKATTNEVKWESKTNNVEVARRAGGQTKTATQSACNSTKHGTNSGWR